MKRIIELEERWKAHKYKTILFYIFIIVFVIFIGFVGVFVKFQYDKYMVKNTTIQNSSVLAKENITSNIDSNFTQSNNDEKNIVEENTINANNSINFVCRKILASMLTVRENASFKSKPVGYYVSNSIFCSEDKPVNGLLKTTHGWVSASNLYSQVVDVNMFVDSGFYKYGDNKIVIKTPVEEVKMFQDNKSTQHLASSDNQSQKNIPIVEAESPKYTINISSEKITKAREIELKQIDFKQTNSYDIAIEVAEYYYEIKDYKNSIKWALNASNADSNDKSKTMSWIIYAKSLYNTGKKEQAIEVLNRYVSSTNSRDATDVLNNMKKGVI